MRYDTQDRRGAGYKGGEHIVVGLEGTLHIVMSKQLHVKGVVGLGGALIT